MSRVRRKLVVEVELVERGEVELRSPPRPLDLVCFLCRRFSARAVLCDAYRLLGTEETTMYETGLKRLEGNGSSVDNLLLNGAL